MGGGTAGCTEAVVDRGGTAAADVAVAVDFKSSPSCTRGLFLVLFIVLSPTFSSFSFSS